MAQASVKILPRLGTLFLTAAVALFGAAGTFHWWNGWVFLAFLAVVSGLSGTLLQKNPSLAKERLKAGSQATALDKVLVILTGGILPLAMMVLAGFDKRWGWTPSITPITSILAGMAMVPSIALTYWAMKSNPFFSSHIRIQKDRGQVVVSTGPYRYIRHPGYSGALFYNLAVPLLLGSWAAFGAGIAIALLIIFRTGLEDGTLRKGLKGYPAYAARVRFRLVPGIW